MSLVRHRRALLLAVCCGLASSADLVAAQTPATTDAPSIADTARAFGLAPESVARDAAIAAALREVWQCDALGDGDGAWRAIQVAHEADESIGEVEPLLLQLLGRESASDLPPIRFVDLDETPLIERAEAGINVAYQEWVKTSEARRDLLSPAPIKARALIRMRSDEPRHRYTLAYLYAELGREDEARAMMEALAPRDKTGYARAHVWQADRLLDGPLNTATLDAVEAHLQRALPNIETPDEVNRRLGELYYFRYVRYRPTPSDPTRPPRESYLKAAEKHFAQVTAPEPKTALTLAEVRSLLGESDKAERGVRDVLARLTKQLADAPDDVDRRLLLAQAHRMVREFDAAVDVLQTGRNLRRDPRYDHELCRVHFFQSRFIRQSAPQELDAQFRALRAAYIANPIDGYVVHRFLEALTSVNADESAAARTTLESLVDAQKPGRIAPLLLAVDRRRRNLPAEADEFFATARRMHADETPEVVAGLIGAVRHGEVKSLNPNVAEELLSAAATLWPEHPNIAKLRGTNGAP